MPVVRFLGGGYNSRSYYAWEVEEIRRYNQVLAKRASCSRALIGFEARLWSFQSEMEKSAITCRGVCVKRLARMSLRSAPGA